MNLLVAGRCDAEFLEHLLHERFLAQELFPFGLEIGREPCGVGDIDHALGQKVGERRDYSVGLLLLADFSDGVGVTDVFQIGLIGMSFGRQLSS